MGGENTKLYNIIRQISLGLMLVSLVIFSLLHSRVMQEDQSFEGQKIFILLDVSQSMNVLDMDGESRLTAAKQHVREVFRSYPEGEYSLGIFAGEAQILSPFTKDTNLLSTFLTGVSYKNIYSQGSSISDGIQSALESIGKYENIEILLYSDGDEEEILLDKALVTQLKDQNIHITFIGVGSESGGYIPTGNMFSPYVVSGGQTVVSVLEESILQQAARELGGSYIRIDDEFELTQREEHLGVSLRALYILLVVAFLSLLSFLSSFFLPYISLKILHRGKQK